MNLSPKPCRSRNHSAKVLVSDQPNVSYICSRYYRAPELCLGVPRYSHAIGMYPDLPQQYPAANALPHVKVASPLSTRSCQHSSHNFSHASNFIGNGSL